jgi:hypothetical protein
MTNDDNSDDWLNDDDPLDDPKSSTNRFENGEPVDDADATKTDTATDGDDGDGGDDQADSDDTELGEQVVGGVQTTGGALGKVFGTAVDLPLRFTFALGRGFTAGMTRRIPFMGSSFWRDMIKFSTHQYQKATGADVVNFSAEANGIEPRAANWQEADPDDPEKQPGWKEVSGSKTWGAGVEGQDAQRFGKADVILSDRSAVEVATPLQMRVAEALDLEQVDGLITSDTTLEQTIVQQWPADPAEMADGANGQAVADGGMMAREEGPIQAKIGNAGFDDAVIDLASDFGDGEGMRISATKYKHQKLANSDPEEMQKQETRGYLAGMSGDNDEKLFYLAVIALFVILLISLGPTIITTLFGGGGGGGGGLPIMLGGLL